MIVENEFPILEYSTEPLAVINPRPSADPFPRLCLMTFFEEILTSFLLQYENEPIGAYSSEMRKFPIYKLNYKGTEICLVQAVVGSGSIAMMTDYLYGKGVEVILCCGSCGVLADIPAGDVIIPVRALRDEGASYKYLPPSRYIELNQEPIWAFKNVLKKHAISYTEGTTWTTDGFYRETKEMVAHRIKQGCKVVEMECATVAAVAEFRHKVFGHLLYSGDILIGSSDYDDRKWYENLSAREKIFYLTLKALTQFKMQTRRFQESDAPEVAALIAKALRSTNIKDYSTEYIENLIQTITPSHLIERAGWTHFYVVCDGETIVGCGAIGPYWGKEDESSLFTIFVLPEYQGQGIGRRIIQTLECDEFFLRAKRVEIPASITACEFYRKMGYDYKDGITTVDKEGLFRLEKFR